MDLENENKLAVTIGTQVLRDADMIRQFLPGHIATFPFVWCGRSFMVTISEADDDRRRE